MRKLMLKRLDFLSKLHQGFGGNVDRWRHCYWRDLHVKAVKFRGLSDTQLIEFYEFIIYRHFKQMQKGAGK